MTITGLAWAAAAVLTTMAVRAESSASAFGDDDRLTRLPPEHRVLAERMTAFVERMDSKYFARVATINGGLNEESLIAEHDYSDYDIRVTRGPVIEKAGRMLAFGKKARAGRGPDNGPLVWGRFYSLDIHPKTPLVGMLHATIVLQFFANGETAVGGWLDVMPGTRVEADLESLERLVDEYFAVHEKDPKLYRRLVCKGTEDTIAEFRRRPSCSGVSFYGPPVFHRDPAASWEFIADLFDQFVGEFLEISERRADDPFEAADIAAQDRMRKRWLVDQLFSDPYASKIVPYNVWFLANVPPVIKF